MIVRILAQTAGTALALVAMAGIAQAALPPHFQRAKEIVAVVEAAAPLLEFMPIDAVEHVGDDAYRVRAGKCVLEVGIVDLPAAKEGFVGPRQFEAVPGKKDCK